MPYLKSLTREVKEMWGLVLSQHQKSLTALHTLDKDLAREIILIEERVNSCEQFIESDCEHYFSLGKSQQTLDIPFAMFALKITRHLEIMGDLAKKIANDILSTDSVYPSKLLEQINLTEPFRTSNKILELTLQAFDSIDPSLAQAALNRIKICREMIADSNRLLADYLNIFPQHVNHGLNLFSVLESIKRTVELSVNISESIINYSQISTVLH